MPRKKRIHYVEAIYHVMLRGNNRQDIFHTDSDRKYFCNLLAKAAKNFSCKFHLYCLMTNHVHLVIEIKQIPLSKIMQSISTSFAMHHHKARNQIGHVFQGRYQAKLVHKDIYLIELCNYIHKNPLKAQMVNNIDLYQWSSHQEYLGVRSTSWLQTDLITGILKKYFNNENEVYHKFIESLENQSAKALFCELDDKGLLVITDTVNKKINNQQTFDLSDFSMQKIADIVCHYFKTEYKNLDSPLQSAEISLTRSLIAYFCHYYANYSLIEIAYLFRRQPDSVSKTMHRHISSQALDTHIINISYELRKSLILSPSTSDPDKFVE